jgi:lipid-binding SYLF domain-containing protein
MKLMRFLLVLITITLSAIPAAPVFADSYAKTIEVFKNFPAVEPFFDTAYGYAVFPTIGKAGIGIGGAYGQGQVYEQGIVRGTAKLFKATIGIQLGGQAFSEIIFFQDKRAFEDFTSGGFEFDAQASAVAITAGAQAKTGTEGSTASASAGPATGKHAKPSYRKGMAVFVQIKGGAMYEATIGGQKFSYTPN